MILEAKEWIEISEGRTKSKLRAKEVTLRREHQTRREERKASSQREKREEQKEENGNTLVVGCSAFQEGR